ncbi:MAG: hypothetical protein JWL97_4221, partial [Gemmatimonadales bacterium]|nr:hypothetical protein [Gemmatimonadales bacterium]
ARHDADATRPTDLRKQLVDVLAERLEEEPDVVADAARAVWWLISPYVMTSRHVDGSLTAKLWDIYLEKIHYEVHGSFVEPLCCSECLEYADVFTAVVAPALDAVAQAATDIGVGWIRAQVEASDHIDLKSMTAVNGDLVMEIGVAHSILGQLLQACQTVLDEQPTTNGVELRAALPGCPGWYTITVQHPGGRTPAEIITDLRTENEELRRAATTPKEN